MSAADIYPQPSGWGVVSVGGTLLQGRTDLHTRPVDTWKVKLAKCGGTVWDPQEQDLPQTNLSPPSTPQSCRGPKVLGEEEPGSVTPKIFLSQPPQYFASTPPRVGSTYGNTGYPHKLEHPPVKLGLPNSPP